MKYVNLIEGVAVSKVNASVALSQDDGYYAVTNQQFNAMKLPARVEMEDGMIADWETIPFDEMPALPEHEIDLGALEEEVRSLRDARLAESDWTQCLDAPIDTDSQLEYRVYRQALRDITEQEGFPLDVTWPEMPETVKADPDPVDEAVDLMLSGEEVTEDA